MKLSGKEKTAYSGMIECYTAISNRHFAPDYLHDIFQPQKPDQLLMFLRDITKREKRTEGSI